MHIDRDTEESVAKIRWVCGIDIELYTNTPNHEDGTFCMNDKLIVPYSIVCASERRRST